MKRILIVSLIFLSSCKQADYIMGNSVEQIIMDDESRLCCGSTKCFTTFVWYKNEIVASWFDSPRTLTDSIVLLRQQQANKLLNTLKLSK